ncbi:TNF receptor-associated factor 5-like [Gigantopelta aegis]|uniref:TNF receptor-associated factor 5-like n=1 Tax=Gigantopelta aegis TaxID=1735272 RepID=UPI001B88E788|nr:TNF receptor-associated factor 5-like [Gigantopelta aegis]
MQTRCGHHLCEKCVGEIFTVDCPAAEENCERLKRNDIYMDNGVRREIRNLSVHCKNSNVGCEFCAPCKDIEKHEATCWFTPVKCPNKQFGCTTILTKTLMSNHEKECQHRQTKCRRCGQTFAISQARQHEENDCPEGQIPCPFVCEVSRIKRKELIEHLMSCTRRPLDCKFKTSGCTFTGSADELAQHERERVSDHLTMHAEQTSEREDLIKQLSECRQENESLKNSIKNLEKTVKGLQNPI